MNFAPDFCVGLTAALSALNQNAPLTVEDQTGQATAVIMAEPELQPTLPFTAIGGGENLQFSEEISQQPHFLLPEPAPVFEYMEESSSAEVQPEPEFYLPVEPLIRILDFLPIMEIARNSRISKVFMEAAEFILKSKFKIPGSDEYDFAKLYREYRRIGNEFKAIYNVAFTSYDALMLHRESGLYRDLKKFRSYLKQLLTQRKIKNDLTHVACSHNRKIELFIDALFMDMEGPIDIENIKLPDEYLNDPLFELLKEFKEFHGTFDIVTAARLEKFGVDFLKGRIIQSLPSLAIVSKVFSHDRDTRNQMLSLFEGKSRSLEALIETENIFDARVVPAEVDLAEFCFLDSLVTDEETCGRAMRLSSEFIQSESIKNIVHLCSNIMKNGLLVSRIIQLYKRGGINVDKLILFLMNRADYEEIYRLAYDVPKIHESIQLNSDEYSPREKIECGLMTGLGDSLLLPIIEAAETLEGVAELIWIAIKLKRSMGIVKALKGKTLDQVDFIMNNNTHVWVRSYVLLDCSPEEIEGYVGISIGNHCDWWEMLTGAAFIEYAGYFLAAGYKFTSGFQLYKLFHQADANQISKYFRYILQHPGDDPYGLAYRSCEEWQDGARRYVRSALEDGIFPHRLFRVGEVQPEKLKLVTGFRKLVLTEILMLEGGFVKLLEGESGKIDFGNPNTRIFIIYVLEFSIEWYIDFEIGYLCDDQDFKELLLLIMLSLLTGIPAEDINLDDYPLERRQASIRTQHPKRWERCSYFMARSFPKRAEEDFLKNFGDLGSFRKALFTVLLEQGLSDLLP